MKITRLCIVALLLASVRTTFADINPQAGQNVWEILSNIGQVSDDRTPIAINATTPYTINSSGNYRLIQDKTGQIVVNADNVCIDLNCYGITHDNANESVITINSNQKNINIYNGWINNSAGPGTGSGIIANSGASYVTVDHVEILNCGTGIKLDGQSGSEVTGCQIMECDFVGNTTGVFLSYADKNELINCNGTDNTQAGYELFHSEENQIIGCQSFETSGSQATIAFKSESGKNNLFEKSIAKQTKTSGTDTTINACGFLLSGTEEKTKIIDCIVNETEATAVGSANAYGIRIEYTESDSNTLNQIDTDGTPSNDVWSVSWESNSEYIATAEYANLRVFSFNGATLVHKDSDNTSSATIRAVAWSPTQNYIATGDADNDLRVYSFNGTTISHITSVNPTGGIIISAVEWKPQGTHIALGDAGDYVRVYSFNGTTLTPAGSLKPSTASINALAWSPDGNYLASVDDNGYLRVYSYNGSTITEIDSDNTPSSRVEGLSWSSSGNYLATGDDNDNIRVFKFDGSDIIPIAVYNLSANVNSVSWSPDGNYLVSADDGQRIRVFLFKGHQSLVEVGVSSAQGDVVRDAEWSPDENYIASGDDTDLVRTFDAITDDDLTTPDNCLLKSNCVCDTSVQDSSDGTGILVDVIKNNAIINNICCNNDINYSRRITNTYGIVTPAPIDLSDNIACC
ncbi:right-handed parallel beta-helix repeat-containing protein [Candidatus Dependentiae bacterium]